MKLKTWLIIVFIVCLVGGCKAKDSSSHDTVTPENNQVAYSLVSNVVYEEESYLNDNQEHKQEIEGRIEREVDTIRDECYLYSFNLNSDKKILSWMIQTKKIDKIDQKFRVKVTLINNENSEDIRTYEGKTDRSWEIFKKDYSSFKHIKSLEVCGVLTNVTNIKLLKPKPLVAIPTFHNISVYLQSKDRGDILLEYRKSGDDTPWLKAQVLKYANIEDYRESNHNGEYPAKAAYRGSIVNLLPNTSYEIRIDKQEKNTFTVSTLSEKIPTINNKGACDDTNEKAECMITKSGTPNNYLLIDGGGAILEADKQYNILLENQSYVIIRNFVLKNAKENAIRMKNAHHIVIEDCDISNWGRESTTNPLFGEQDGAIFSNFNLWGSVIQRNKIYNPRYDTNSWGEFHGKRYHPSGPQGVTLKYCNRGNNVIRYNEFYSTNGHYFNDVMGGSSNGSHYGFPGADSDIYGNYLANAWDDGIEVEGGGENIRVWNNYIEKTYIAIGNAIVTLGPLYIWRNIAGEAQTVNNYDEDYNIEKGRQFRGSFLKMGGKNKDLMKGQIYLYNNTLLNKDNKGYGGVGSTEKKVFEFGQSVFSNRTMRNITTRNNILDVPNGINSLSKGHRKSIQKTENYGYDMVVPTQNINGERLSYVPDYYGNHKIESRPIYDGQARLHENRSGNFRLKANTIGTGVGECIDNIIPSNNPDVGAQDSSVLHMYFGTKYRFSVPNIELCLD